MTNETSVAQAMSDYFSNQYQQDIPASQLQTQLAALVTGFLARRSAKAWSLGRFIATYLLALVIILVLYWIGAKGR